MPTLLDAATSQARITLPVTPSTLGIVDYSATLLTVADDMPSARLEVHATSAWLGSTPDSASAITTPDLSHLPGWIPEMGLRPSTPLDFYVDRYARNMPRGTQPVDGRYIMTNELNGVLTPP